MLFGAETLLYSNRNGSKDKIDRWPGKKWLPQWRSLPNFYLFYIARWISICLSISISQSDRRCSFSVKVSCYSQCAHCHLNCERDISNRFSTMVWIIHFAFNFAIVISAHFLLCSFSYLELFFSVNYRIVTISNFNKEAKCGKRYCFISTPLACLSSMILTFIAALAQVQNEWKISRWHSWSQIAHRAKNYFQIATALHKHVTDNGKSRATWAFDNRVSLRLFVPVEEVYLTSKLLWHWFPLRLISAIHDAVATFYFRVWVWGWEC